MSFGEVTVLGAAANGPGVDSLIEYKEVLWRPATSTHIVKVGQPVCYNSDLAADYKERTTNPVDANAASNNSGTAYAEGAQTYDGRIFIVERPASTNLHQFAGTAMVLGDKAGADGDKIVIAVPNGAMVPVYTDQNCTQGATLLAIRAGQSNYTSAVYGGSTTSFRIVGLAEETIDRSSTNGLCWAHVWPAKISGYGVSANQLTLGTGVTSGEVMGDIISLKTAQTGGTFSALRLRGELNGAGSGASLGAALRCEGVANSTALTSACAASIHMIFKTGATNAGSGELFEGLYCKVENQDATPAALASAIVSAARFVTQLNEDPGAHYMLRFEAEGSDTPDAWISAKSAAAIAAYASTSDAPALATGDMMIPIDIAGTTYYLVALQDTGV